MSALDDIVEAIRAADDDGWAVADAIARIPRRGEDGYVTNDGIAKYIATKHPIEFSANYVSIMRATADAFPPLTRVKGVNFSAHRIMRTHPAKLHDWAKRHPGESLSATEADKLRPKSAAAKAKPDAWKAKVDRALGVIANEAEHDPAWTVDVMRQAIATIERRHAKRLERSRALRVV